MNGFAYARSRRGAHLRRRKPTPQTAIEGVDPTRPQQLANRRTVSSLKDNEQNEPGERKENSSIDLAELDLGDDFTEACNSSVYDDEGQRRGSSASNNSSNSINSFQAAFTSIEPVYTSRVSTSSSLRPSTCDSQESWSSNSLADNAFKTDVRVFEDNGEGKPTILYRKALFDTGCEGSNWVLKSIVDKLGAKVYELQEQCFVTLEGEQFSAFHTTKLCFQNPTGAKTYEADFIINDKLPHDLVLGARFCFENKVFPAAVLGGLRPMPKTKSEKKVEFNAQQKRDQDRNDDKKKKDEAKEELRKKKAEQERVITK